MHDPTMISQGNNYSFFSTGDTTSLRELPIQRSTDLVNWDYLDGIFNNEIPGWIVAELGGYRPVDLWAPDVSFSSGDPDTTSDDEHRVYYAGSQFGTTNSIQDTPGTMLVAPTDADGEPLVYTVASQPVHGTLEGDAPHLTYIPAGGYHGADSFTFVANDGTAGSNSATITIMVDGAPRLPTDGPYSVLERGTVQLTASRNDPEGAALTYARDLDGAGAFETAGQHTTFDAGALDGPTRQEVAVRVTGPGGQIGTARGTVIVANVAPQVRAIAVPDSPAHLASTVQGSAPFDDPGLAVSYRPPPSSPYPGSSEEPRQQRQYWQVGGVSVTRLECCFPAAVTMMGQRGPGYHMLTVPRQHVQEEERS